MFSVEIEVLLRSLAGLLIVINITGNFLVCLVVRRFRFMKTPMNYLLVNLAISDMIAGIFLFPRVVLIGVYEHPSGITGDFLCKTLTNGNFGWIASVASIYTLITIAWERYNAILKPHATRFTSKQIKIAIVWSWILGVLICLTETIALSYNPSIKSCDYVWWSPGWYKVDASLWLFAVGLLPSLVLLGLYGRVIRNLWCSNNRISDVAQRSLLKSRKRVTKATITVTAILFFCWMPNLMYYFINTFTPGSSSTTATMRSVSPVFYRVSHILILMNSSVNPFVYSIQDIRFRSCMSRLLCGRLITQNSIQKEDTTLAPVQ